MESSPSSIAFIYFYIIAFIYIREPNYKHIGYIMLTIVYIFSGVAVAYAYSIYPIANLINNPLYLK